MDETFIGGKARNMHKDRKKKLGAGTGLMTGKSVVLGILEREKEGKPRRIRASVIADRKKVTIAPEVQHTSRPDRRFTPMSMVGVWAMRDQYVHNIVNHAECYVKENVHTNTLETFWSLL